MRKRRGNGLTASIDGAHTTYRRDFCWSPDARGGGFGAGSDDGLSVHRAPARRSLYSLRARHWVSLQRDIQAANLTGFTRAAVRHATGAKRSDHRADGHAPAWRSTAVGQRAVSAVESGVGPLDGNRTAFRVARHGDDRHVRAAPDAFGTGCRSRRRPDGRGLEAPAQVAPDGCVEQGYEPGPLTLASASSRSARRSTFPTIVLGSSVRSSIFDGTL
jgi:hypothetical protein